jgi:hypothetical protein
MPYADAHRFALRRSERVTLELVQFVGRSPIKFKYARAPVRAEIFLLPRSSLGTLSRNERNRNHVI